MKLPIIAGLCVLGTAATLIVAQESPERPPREGRPPGPGGAPRFVMPIMRALDANSDGTLDATEISNASAALKTLDKNSDGKITPDELRPARPDGARPGGGEGGRRNRPDGERSNP